jgi:serine/threonine protein phosphatase PrpC
VVIKAWQSATSCSVIGAAHRRQGKPCQDASLSSQLGTGSQQLQLMAVSDGHGGSRYWLSDIGSNQACLAVRESIERALQHTPLADRDQWLQLLQTELPEAIQQRWLEAVQRDWQQRPESATTPFSSAVYGCTLGFVLLAPQWWGCSGIGDWDLVGLNGAGEANLLSEETLEGSHGEATTSLCQADLLEAWRQRAQLQELRASDSLQALVLCTDGIRKSCATDRDFLELCSQMITLESGDPLEQGLVEITAQGSGDDVSVAIVQRSGPRAARLPLGPAALAIVIVAAGGGGWWWWQQRPTPIEREVAQLCEAPERIKASLSQRKEQFQQLLQQPKAAEALLKEPERDPLGALIASSAGGTTALQTCPPLKEALDAQWRMARKTPEQPAPAQP